MANETLSDRRVSHAQTTWTATDIFQITTEGDASKVMTLDDLFTEIAVGPVVKGTVQGPAGVTELDGLLITTPAITTAIGRGLNVVMDWSGATGATGIQSASTVSGDGNHGHCYGLQSWTYHTSTGTTTDVAGLMSQLTASAGTITNWYGLYFPSIDIAGATVTNKWHIYAASARRSYLPGGIVTCDDLVTAPTNTPTATGGVIRVHHARGALGGGTGFAKSGITVLSTDAAAVGMGGVIALGGYYDTGLYNFAFITGAKESAGATYNGYLAIHTTDAGSNNSEKMRVTGTGGNMCLGTTAAGTNAVKTLAIGLGTAPASSPTDIAQLYVGYQAGAGTACLHTRTEGGAVVKLFQGAAVADPTDATSTMDRLKDLLARLRAHGLIAT